MSKKEYPAKLTNGYYRVREVWEDEASQLGAYRLLANAKAKCDENPGSHVFDNDGNVIYPEEAVPDTGADESEEKAVVDDIPEEKPETTVLWKISRRRKKQRLKWMRTSSRQQRNFRQPLLTENSRPL